MVLNGSDRELIELCRRGDHDAFEALFEAHKDKVYSIALRYSGDPAAAMDIAQDTFLKLLSRIKDFRGDSSFDTWLYRLVANACVDHQRRGRRWLPVLDDLLDAFCAPRETVLNTLLRQETEEHVRRVVSRLPPQQRIIVVLRYTEGLSYDAIAEIAGCSPGTVASRLNRAHKTLERRLSHLRKAGPGTKEGGHAD
jgi:RNA polymerase sigma-70 factor (ECF subfamily)